MENLRHLNFAPSVQMHGMHYLFLTAEVPKDMFSDDDDDEDQNKDRRITRNLVGWLVEKMSDRRRVPENELSDSEDEGDGRRDERSYKERSLMSHDKGETTSSQIASLSPPRHTVVADDNQNEDSQVAEME